MVRISDTIKEDHRLLREYHDKIIHAGDEDTGTRWGNKFTWELARYTVAEELVVYPALESYIDHGKIMADKDRRENQEVCPVSCILQPSQEIQSLFQEKKKKEKGRFGV
ncbi:HHE domain-containing protein [Histoplasma capsulatum var. duboisii H88]|uniref:HHE domain-containing protein n=1 Tax=Ajellomyces capsulatus (strain H88) TaxID=544711 RepID=A0A8A1LDN6_AJEC8|nr:HHE domain-containing protein [Histoplasma capsulatum var. duboisii H88]